MTNCLEIKNSLLLSRSSFRININHTCIANKKPGVLATLILLPYRMRLCTDKYKMAIRVPKTESILN